MSAYIMVRVNISDPIAYGQYIHHTPRVVDRLAGRLIVRGGELEMLEGEEETVRLAVIEFPSMDHAKRFYRSEEYQAVKCLREGAGEVQLYAIDGYAKEEWDSALKASKSLSL
jgi:uncharacterized protein (DUF1330 family)